MQPAGAGCLGDRQLQSTEGCLPPAEQPRVPVFQPAAALQGAVDVSLFCTPIFGFLAPTRLAQREGEIQVHQNHFHPKNPISSQSTFIKNQFHQIQFHQKPLSSKTNFFTHQIERWDRTKHDWDGKNKKVRISVEASPAEGRRRFHRNTAYARLSGFGV